MVYSEFESQHAQHKKLSLLLLLFGKDIDGDVIATSCDYVNNISILCAHANS